MVDRVDGGLARKRWEKKDGQVSRRAVGEIKRVPVGLKDIVQSPLAPGRSQWPTHGRTHGSHVPRMPGDGAMSGSSESANDGGECIVPLDSTIYISILDPIGEPAFKPSPTKPIPRWMQWLPSQRNRHRRNEPRPYSLLDEYFPPNPVSSTGDSISKRRTICPTNPTQDSPYPTIPPRHRRTPQNLEFTNTAESTIKAIKGPSFVLDEPLMRPSSRMTHSTSNSSKSGKGDAFASPYPSDMPPPRNLSPYAPRKPSPLSTHEEVPEPSDRDKSWKARLHRSPSPLSEHVAAHLQRYIRRTPPAQSKEFINLYRPLQPPNPGLAVPGRKLDKDVGDGRPLRRMLSRCRTPSPHGEDGGVVPEQAVMGTGDVVDVRSVRKRSSLQSEIRKLLGGRGQGRERE
ncbi:hypothetical protein F4781DRAFT_415796 [Annulohypoxylon bovei var. microspora]|nr:hypothetical protein F4781DRAFT_415796 [Annulohypoxylon bovei var. microspora]